eukprot:COSAG02_NODE_28250_length_592_cov_0.803644_1_plen_93_part_10
MERESSGEDSEQISNPCRQRGQVPRAGRLRSRRLRDFVINEIHDFVRLPLQVSAGGRLRCGKVMSPRSFRGTPSQPGPPAFLPALSSLGSKHQ